MKSPPELDIMALDNASAVAIVGMAGRFPGAANVRSFWDNLLGGVESIHRFQPHELTDAFTPAVRNSAEYVAARPILDGIDQFDAEFFGMYAREAALTDPQHRVFLECCWEALEDGACDPARHPGAIGVFAGCSMNTYFLHNVCHDRAMLEEFTSNFQVGCYPTLVGAGREFLATRVSYKLDLRGPSMTVQSACSTSLLAVSEACKSLILFESDLALAGGVSISLPQQRGYLHQPGGMVSADGHCRPFDAQASGTIFGSGAGVVLLKRLSEALADGDRIYAVIRGCGVNNDGASKVGFTAPSVDAQSIAVQTALANAGVSARSIGYVECHGTATPLGDPIEVAALSQAFAADQAQPGQCSIGSVKSNVGHLDAAAGVTGLIKTALALSEGEIPPTLHYQSPNPQIDFAATPFRVSAARQAWPQGDKPRRAGVSALGVGGTNVHVVLEEAPLQSAAKPACGPQLLLLSARDDASLLEARQRLATHLQDRPNDALADVAWTLQRGRKRFAQRCVVVASDSIQATARLRGEQPGSICGQPEQASKASPKIGFMLPGQGAQYPGMGDSLYRSEAVFRDVLNACSEIIGPLAGSNLARLLYPKKLTPAAARRLQQTAVAQPAIFALEYALAQLWLSWGIRPQALIGHSVGEFVAAVLAGVMELPDALSLVVERGRLMQALPAGGMLAVPLPEAETRQALTPELALAAVNGPALCVVSGPVPAIEDLEQELSACAMQTRRLHTSHAFHSAMVEPVIAPLQQRLAEIKLKPAEIPCISGVSGNWLSDEQATSAAYWAAHAREPVRFADGVQQLASRATQLIEIGPGATLATLARQNSKQVRVVQSLAGPEREIEDMPCLYRALGQLWLAGVEADWAAVQGSQRHIVSLPAYPFQRRRHWIDPPSAGQTSTAPPSTIDTSESSMTPTAATIAAPATPAIDQRAHALSAVYSVLEELSGQPAENQDADASFLELGFDSLFLSQVTQKLLGQFGLRLTLRQLLGEASTPGSLASLLMPHLSAADPAPCEMPVADASASKSPPGASSGAAEVAPQAISAAASRVQAASTVRRTESEFTPAQQAHILALEQGNARRMAGSKQLTQQHRKVLADPRAAAGFRSDWKELVYPIVAQRASGCHIWDVDGNQYIDLVNGFGQTMFGHSPDFVVDAVKAQLDKGFAIGPQAEQAGAVAALFAELTGHQRVSFCNTGSEAVMAAMRVARTVTGRDKIAMFAGDYHGQFDEVLVRGVQHGEPRALPAVVGVPAASVSNVVVLEYGSETALTWLRAHAQELAAVLVEPVQSRHPDLQPFDFLRELRSLTQESGTALVMDEVVTGFRVHPAGVQGLLGIQADLATYGKVVGGGMPVGVLAGSARFMDALDGGSWNYGDESFPEAAVTFFAGTFVRHPLVLAATQAVLDRIRREGPELQTGLSARAENFAEAINALFIQFGLKARLERFGSLMHFHLHDEHPLAMLLYYHLRSRGVYAQDGYPCFLTTAHSEADLARVVDAFRDSLYALAEAGVVAMPKVATPAGEIAVTESQLEVWLAAQSSDAASCAFNESVTLRLAGTLDAQAMENAIEQLVSRHDALRASFGASGEFFRISETLKPDMQRHDFTGDSPQQAEIRLRDLIAEEARQPFKLTEGPLLRAQLVAITEQIHALVLTAHHIICDGWSMNVLIDELSEIYSALVSDVRAALPEPSSFAAFARQQLSRHPAERARIETYWRNQFEPPAAALELATDHARSTPRSYAGATRTRFIDKATAQAIRKSAARTRQTLFTTLLGAFQALAGRLANTQDVTIAVPMAGQNITQGGDKLVGHCVNFLPIRVRWDSRTTVAAHLARVGNQVLDAQEHQDTTLGSLAQLLAPTRQQHGLPLTSLQFNLERLAEPPPIPGLTLSIKPNDKAAVVFDLFLNVIAGPDGLRLDCDYNSEVFDAATIDHWLASYQALLESMLADVQRPLLRVPCLPPAQHDAMLGQLLATATNYPGDQALHRLIEVRAKANPQAIAVVCGEESLSYGELEQRANRLAHHLLKQLGPNRVIGLAVERSSALPVALLATLKAGCAYVPLDMSFPAERLLHMLKDSAAVALISSGDVSALSDCELPRIRLTEDAAVIDAQPATPPQLEVDPRELAYIIYTSGSTGKPKGVEIEHRSLVNLLSAMQDQPGLSASDALLAVTTIAFDIAALELYLPLLSGAKLVLADAAEIRDGHRLLARLRDSQANVVQATPSGWRLLLEAGFRSRPGQRLLAGGEPLPRELADRLLEGGAELWNMYGPTETTIWSSCGKIEPSPRADTGPATGRISIGHPIANTQFYLLDSHQQPLPIGVPGELHIGGDGVARGYRGQAELSSERFIANPYGPGRLYCSGDLARQRADGEFELLGRLDQQVKLRGFRIELGEIEARLNRQDTVSAAAVALREEHGAARLVAYVVPTSNNTLHAKELSIALAKNLPDYMIPSTWVQLDELPLTPNGKLDRKALPTPTADALVAEQLRPPQGAVEQALAAICAEVLPGRPLGANSDLVAIGADSIQLFQIVARAHRQGLPITARQVMNLRSIEKLAAALAEEPTQTRKGKAAMPQQPKRNSLADFKRRRSAENTAAQA